MSSTPTHLKYWSHRWNLVRWNVAVSRYGMGGCMFIAAQGGGAKVRCRLIEEARFARTSWGAGR